MIKRIAIFLYGVASYAIFFLTFLYAIGFIGNLVVPVTMDGPPALPFWQALAVNLGLLSLFAVQHSVMARPAFKRRWTQIVPQPAERSTYVLFSSACLIALFAFWQPLGGVVWSVQDPVGQTALYALFALGWGLVLVSTFLINHFDLFGLRQVWLQLVGKPYTEARVRHAGALPLRASPAVCRLALHLLGDAANDGDPPRVRARDDGVHPRCGPIRRARPCRRASRIRGVSAPGSNVDPELPPEDCEQWSTASSRRVGERGAAVPNRRAARRRRAWESMRGRSPDRSSPQVVISPASDALTTSVTSPCS